MSTTAPRSISRSTSAADTSRRDLAATVIVAIQAAACWAAAVGIFAGVGIGTAALRIGVGALFMVLGLVAAGIALGLNEGQPSARTAALVFESFAITLAVLWVAPVVL
jgi:hypothetical protein